MSTSGGLTAIQGLSRSATCTTSTTSLREAVGPGGLDTEEPVERPAAVGGGSGEGHDQSGAEHDQGPRAASGRQLPNHGLAPRAARVAGRCRGREPVAQALVWRSPAYADGRAPGPGRRVDRDDRARRSGGAVADRVLHPAVGLVARLGEPDPRAAAAGDHGHAGRRRQSHRHTSRRWACWLRTRRPGPLGMPARRLPFGIPRRSVSAIHIVTASAAAASPP